MQHFFLLQYRPFQYLVQCLTAWKSGLLSRVRLSGDLIVHWPTKRDHVLGHGEAKGAAA